MWRFALFPLLFVGVTFFSYSTWFLSPRISKGSIQEKLRKAEFKILQLSNEVKQCSENRINLNHSVSPPPQELLHSQDIFEHIYRNGTWGNEGNGSGIGSSLKKTEHTRELLMGIIRKYKIQKFLDAPCGGMKWMPFVLEMASKENPNFEYLGLDVVRYLIKAHRLRFATQPKWRFQHCDLAYCPLPFGYDLIFSRDSLQHLPFVNIFKFLQDVRENDAKYLLVGSYLNRTKKEINKDVPIGGVFYINLLEPPFSLPPPIEIFDEKTPRIDFPVTTDEPKSRSTLRKSKRKLNQILKKGRKFLLLFEVAQLRTNWTIPPQYLS